jgi:hypothetical protein
MSLPYSQLLATDLRRGLGVMAPKKPRFIRGVSNLKKRHATFFHGIEWGDPQQVLFQGADAAFRIPMPLRCPYTCGGTLHPQKGHCILQDPRHMLTAMLMPQDQAPGHGLATGTPRSASSLFGSVPGPHTACHTWRHGYPHTQPSSDPRRSRWLLISLSGLDPRIGHFRPCRRRA